MLEMHFSLEICCSISQDAYATETDSPSQKLRELKNNFESFISQEDASWDASATNDCPSLRLRELKKNLESFSSSTSTSCVEAEDITDPMKRLEIAKSSIKEVFQFLNTANREELKRLRCIGETRADYILELREESPEPFKSLDDLQKINISAKQGKSMMKKMMAEDIFN